MTEITTIQDIQSGIARAEKTLAFHHMAPWSILTEQAVSICVECGREARLWIYEKPFHLTGTAALNDCVLAHTTEATMAILPPSMLR